MSIKPILFKTEMVRAILDGRKTVTRRVVKKKYGNTDLEMFTNKYGTRLVERQNDASPDEEIIMPDGQKGTRHHLAVMREVPEPYHTGDILWVRETFFRDECTPFCGGWDDPGCCPFTRVENYCYGYRAQYGEDTGEIKWHPSIHMPKSAARLFLRVTAVRVERLQTMDVINCVREGATWHEYPCAWTVMAKPSFIELWNSTIKPADLSRYGWGANPFVWVVEFERCEKPDGFLKEGEDHEQ